MDVFFTILFVTLYVAGALFTMDKLDPNEDDDLDQIAVGVLCAFWPLTLLFHYTFEE